MGKFFEASCEEDNDVYKSDRYTSPRRKSDDWKGLYFERKAAGNSPNPLKDQIDAGESCYNRLAKLLEIDDSPIRKKVAFAALEPY